jgi:NAD+ synthase
MFVTDPRLEFDPDLCADEIATFLREQLRRATRGQGYVIGLSGGVDSATTAALAVRAVGRERVHGLLLPDRHSLPESAELALETAATLGIDTTRIDLTPILEALALYAEQDSLLRTLDPDYDENCTFRLVLPEDLRSSRALNIYTLEVVPEDGTVRRHRIPAAALRRLQALTNVKLRLRMTLLYRDAETRGGLVAGTTNRCETDQGFFVQYGDGGVDVEPIAHLYKCQVRELASRLGFSDEIASRPATPDTWSAAVGDEEFFFRLPYSIVDSILVREELGFDDNEIARELDMETEQVSHLRAELARRRDLSASMRSLPPNLFSTFPQGEALR